MPPKGSKGTKQRAQPYPPGTRKSSRQVTESAKKKASNSGQSAAASSTPEQVNLVPPDTQPTTSQSVLHDRVINVVSQQPTSNAISEPQPGTSSDTGGNSQPQSVSTVPQLQVNSGVSRHEFDQMKDSMSSMKEMLSNFMSKFSPSSQSQNNNQQAAQAPHAFQRPDSVPVEGLVVTQQPLPINVNDQNLPIIQPITIDNNHAAANIVGQAMNAHVQNISGNNATLGKPKGDKSYQLDRKIPQYVMQDIWEDKLVDLELLLDKKQDPTAPMVLKTVQSDNLGELVQVVKPKPPKTIVNIDQWTYAFDIYISMYTRKYWHETHNLLTYSNKVKELAAKGGDFLRYDEEFRKMRARYGTPWETPDLELWVDCHQAALPSQVMNIINTLNQHTSLNSPFRPPTKPITLPDSTPDLSDIPKPRHPNGACYTYHNKGRCGRAQCKFSHLCYQCGQKHSVFKCPQSPNSGLYSPPGGDNPSSSGGRRPSNTSSNSSSTS